MGGGSWETHDYPNSNCGGGLDVIGVVKVGIGLVTAPIWLPVVGALYIGNKAEEAVSDAWDKVNQKVYEWTR